jgi:hypothetical protein
MNRHRLNRLAQQGPTGKKAAACMRRLFGLRYERPAVEDITRTVSDVIGRTEGWWSKAESQRDRALDGLMEFSVLGLIGKAVTEAPKWSLLEIRRHEPFGATFEHEEQPITLSVGKEAPGPDVYKTIRERAGMAKHVAPRDSQPDVCLTFEHEPSGRTIAALGDSKRNANASDHGKSYLREGLRTATYYLSAFAEALDARMEAGRLVGALRPTFTLFFRQGTETRQTLKLLTEEDPAALPPILAYDVESHIQQNKSSAKTDTETNTDGFFELWFRHLSRQAISYLENSGA